MQAQTSNLAVLACLTLLTGLLQAGCASQPVVTKELYQDRSMWVRLEKNPYAEPAETAAKSDKPSDETQLTAGALAAWLKGFRVLTDRGIYGMAAGKDATTPAFVEQEIMALTPHLATALALAKPDERVAYCFVADRNQEERYITTASFYVKKPHIYYKLDEYRTLVRVPSLAASTSDACRTKPQPGYKTADRYFRLEYEPIEFVVGEAGFFEQYGSFMAATIMNRRGEVVFKLSSLLPARKPSLPKTISSPQAAPTPLAQSSPMTDPASTVDRTLSPPPSSSGPAAVSTPATPTGAALQKSAGDLSPPKALAVQPQKKPRRPNPAASIPSELRPSAGAKAGGDRNF
jgi:hypothetical protein